MRKFKKFIALLMTVMMFISMLPMDALAEIIAGGGNASEGKQIPISLLSVVPDEGVYVTFKFMNGEDLVDKQIVKQDGQQTVVEPATPVTPEGKRFDGWYVGDTKLAFGVVSGYTESTEVTVTAKFTDVFYVYFLATDGSVYATKEAVSPDYTVTPVTDYEPKDAVLTGWVIKGTNTEFTADTTVTADTYVTPVITLAYWVTFNTDGGTGVDSKYVKKGDSVDLSTVPEPTKVGYEFAGWKYKDGNPASEIITPTESIVLTAVWNAAEVKYTVVYWGENADDENYSVLATDATKEAKTGDKLTLDETTGALPTTVADGQYFTLEFTI